MPQLVIQILARPFISPFGFTITPALSAKKMKKIIIRISYRVLFKLFSNKVRNQQLSNRYRIIHFHIINDRAQPYVEPKFKTRYIDVRLNTIISTEQVINT